MNTHAVKLLLVVIPLLVFTAGCQSKNQTTPAVQLEKEVEKNAVMAPVEESKLEGVENEIKKNDVRITELVTTGEKATPRQLASGGYDPKRKVFYVFGGRDDQEYQNDLYGIDVDKGIWKQIEVDGLKPSPRYGTPLMIDHEGGFLYLFGGQNDSSAFLDDFWRFNLATSQWESIIYDNGPVGRYGHGGIFDEANGGPVIGFGFVSGGRTNDTWRYHLAEKKWVDISPDESTRPQERCLLATAHNPGDDSLWLFGGQSTGVPGGKRFLGDFWRLDTNTKTWEELDVPSELKARKWPTISALKEKLVVFGGNSADGDLNDIWVYDKSVGQWSSPTISEIPPRSSHVTAVDEENNRIIVFGGSGEKLYNDVWIIQF